MTTKQRFKQFWEDNKKKILIGGSVIVGGIVGLTIYKSKTEINPIDIEDAKKFIFKPFEWVTKPSRPIPNVEGFSITDIGEDCNDGCITWLDGCKLADCGKLGEGLSKIERVDPEMKITMVILAKDIV